MLPEGAFYVECDTNLPSGESLIRQLQWGKKWFREELGVDSQVGWLPDCFGFSAALPQLLKGLGIPYFATRSSSGPIRNASASPTITSSGRVWTARRCWGCPS